MKIAVIVVRVLMGLLFLFASVSFFLKLGTPPPMQGDMKTFMDGIAASKYLLPVVKVIELVCGIAFVSGFFVPLATVVIFPIIINIVLVHVCLDPSGAPMGVILLLANLFLAYNFRAKYQPILSAK